MLTRTKPPVKRHRLKPIPEGHTFAQGLYKPVPPEPTVDPMPTPLRASQGPQRVRWVAVDLTPLEDLVSPEPEMSVSGAWRMPGEDWSWEIGFAEID
jgi:hypothetical protein